MRVLLLNPPSPERVNRRFRCTYRARHFLFPPLELLLLGGVSGAIESTETTLVDAVAEDLDLEETLARAQRARPDLTVYLAGNDTLGTDVELGARLRERLPGRPVLVTGYLPSLYPRQVLDAGGADGVLLGEPETTFERVLRGGGIRDVEGIATLGAAGRPGQLPEMDWLPAPDYRLARLDRYSEFFLPRPFAVLQTSRGCPFGCSYCVHPHGRKMRYRSVERVLDDVEWLEHRLGVRTIRFEDDLFTLLPERVEAICKGMLDRGTKVQWTCLARPDTLGLELARLMARAGCVRIYMGIETASERIWKELGRGGQQRAARSGVAAASRAGIETAGFFIVGLPSESEDEFRGSVELASELDLDYVCISQARPYPGTTLFESHSDEVELQLMPFRARFKDPEVALRARRRERRFYRDFYLRPAFLRKIARRTLARPLATFAGCVRLALSLLPDSQPAVREDLV